MPNIDHRKSDPVRVAVGVIYDQKGRILVSFRSKEKHQGGLWEFPGGKVESGESSEAALARELLEELGIAVLGAVPLMQISYEYPEKNVLLDVYKVHVFKGIPQGKEGQEIRWVFPRDLTRLQFPSANQPIIKAAQLSNLIAITKEDISAEEFLPLLDKMAERNIGMLQIRAPARTASEVCDFLALVQSYEWEAPPIITVNSSIGARYWGRLPGLHLTSGHLTSVNGRPVSEDIWLGASCHTKEQIKKACDIGVNYIFVSPVMKSRSHPNTEGIGWQQFQDLSRVSTVPVYALGGLKEGDLLDAYSYGAAGIAGISFFSNEC